MAHATHRTHKNSLRGRWAQTIGPPECPIMRRWILQTPLGSVRLHHFVRPDDQRHLHDHPWWFITLVLKGGYTDITMIDGVKHQDVLKPGSIRFRPSHHTHIVDTQNSWTLVITGRLRRKWGFWTEHGFEPVRDYFAKFGYAPCED